MWIVENGEELEDDKVICECREQREVEEGTGRLVGRSGCWAQNREDQCDGFSGNDAVQQVGFDKIRANRQGAVGQIHANRCDGFGKGDADQRERNAVNIVRIGVMDSVILRREKRANIGRRRTRRRMQVEITGSLH